MAVQIGLEPITLELHTTIVFTTISVCGLDFVFFHLHGNLV